MYVRVGWTAGGRDGARTLLVNLLACQLALVAHEVAQDAREEVGAARATSVARGVLGGTLVKVLLIGVVVGNAVLHCDKARRLAILPFSALIGEESIAAAAAVTYSSRPRSGPPRHSHRLSRGRCQYII